MLIQALDTQFYSLIIMHAQGQVRGEVQFEKRHLDPAASLKSLALRQMEIGNVVTKGCFVSHRFRFLQAWVY